MASAVACVEYCSVAPEDDWTPIFSARLWDEGDACNLARTAEEVHAAVGLAGIQLCYGGANAQSLESRGTLRGPSPLQPPPARRRRGVGLRRRAGRGAR